MINEDATELHNNITKWQLPHIPKKLKLSAFISLHKKLGININNTHIFNEESSRYLDIKIDRSLTIKKRLKGKNK